MIQVDDCAYFSDGWQVQPPTRWWQLKYFWNFHPEIWGRCPILTCAYFSDGWQVQPPPSQRVAKKRPAAKKVSAIACEIARIYEVNCRGLEQQDVGFCWLFVLGWFGFGFGVSCFVCLSWQLFSKSLGSNC